MLDLDTAVRLATIELRSKDGTKGQHKIQAVQQEEEEDNIEAISQNKPRSYTKIEASSKTATKLGQISGLKTTSATTREISSREDQIWATMQR